MRTRQLQTTTTSVGVSSNSNNYNDNNINIKPYQRQDGCLEITVLQLVDLPYQDLVPLGIQFSVVTTSPGTNCAKKTTTTTKVWSGPPTQRLRNRSSFRFAPGVLELVEPLNSLYHAKLKVEVIYDNSSSNAGTTEGATTTTTTASSLLQPITYLQAEFPIRQQLCIGRPKDLSLLLRPTEAAITRTTTTTTTNKSRRVVTSMDDDTSITSSTTFTTVSELESPPTIRLHLNLLGPMRPTVQVAYYYLEIYLNLIDQIQDQLFSPIYDQVIKPIWPVLPVGLGLGAVPIVTTAVVASPLVMGISLLFFPITIPLVVLLVLLLSGGVGIVSILLCSTRQGRAMIDTNLIQHDWVQSFVMTSPITQSIIFDTGDDDAIPNPVSVLRWYIIPEGVWYRLLLSLTIDLVGSLSYLLPVVGESFDGPWGPIQSMLIMALYNQTTPSLKYVSLAEEWLPFTDILPSATIGWATENMPWLIEESKGVWSGWHGPLMTGSSGGEDKDACTNKDTLGSNNISTNHSKSQPTPEQKRSILRDMQNYSERLSLHS